jgi:hypothetical protein
MRHIQIRKPKVAPFVAYTKKKKGKPLKESKSHLESTLNIPAASASQTSMLYRI